MSKIKHYKTIVISDIHLGMSDSKAKELVRFLKKNICNKLILNGDIIDGWRLRRGGEWKKKHTRFFRVVLKMIERHGTEVIYTRGNHDDFLDNFIPFTAGRFSIVKDYIYESHNRKYWVLHGDVFDSITTHWRWLAKLGDIGYNLLLWTNKIYNNNRIRKGLPYYSLSKDIKQKVKTAVSYFSDFEKELASMATVKGMDGVICGHIHHPSIATYNNIIYMNSGDWVESLSALVEDHEGNWKIIYYTEWQEEMNKIKLEKKSGQNNLTSDTDI